MTTNHEEYMRGAGTDNSYPGYKVKTIICDNFSEGRKGRRTANKRQIMRGVEVQGLARCCAEEPHLQHLASRGRMWVTWPPLLLLAWGEPGGTSLLGLAHRVGAACGLGGQVQ